MFISVLLWLRESAMSFNVGEKGVSSQIISYSTSWTKQLEIESRVCERCAVFLGNDVRSVILA